MTDASKCIVTPTDLSGLRPPLPDFLKAISEDDLSGGRAPLDISGVGFDAGAGPGPMGGVWSPTPNVPLVTSPGRVRPAMMPPEPQGSDLSLPFEYYVRGIVRSELMKNEVPITESFQDAAAAAAPVATGRGVESAEQVLGQIAQDYAKLQQKLYGGGKA